MMFEFAKFPKFALPGEFGIGMLSESDFANPVGSNHLATTKSELNFRCCVLNLEKCRCRILVEWYKKVLYRLLSLDLAP
jgi:hypothetical protein